MRVSVVGAVLVAATACHPDQDAQDAHDAHDAGNDDGSLAADPLVVCAATQGGPGGEAGRALVLLGADADAASVLADHLEDVVMGGPGAGGRGGQGSVAADGAEGQAGPDDEALDVLARPEWTFDASDIDPDTRIDISTDQGEITIPELSDPPDIVVSELRVRAGATVRLTCDARIKAERIVVEAGATLGFASRNQAGCAWVLGGPSSEPTTRGGAVWLETRSLELDGTLDLGGNTGSNGGAGGAGGTLTLLAETVTLGDGAELIVAGGAGGDGIPETPC